MHHNNMIMITCVMKVKENTRIILLYEKKKLQLNAYKRLFDNEYLISIHDIMRYLFLILERLLRKHNTTDYLLMTGQLDTFACLYGYSCCNIQFTDIEAPFGSYR